MGGGRGAARRRFCSSRFSTALRLHSSSNMAVPVEMDCRQPDRFAAVVSHVLGSIPVYVLVCLSESLKESWPTGEKVR